MPTPDVALSVGVFTLRFLISGIVPFFGLLAAVAYRYERDELRRRCPRCGRVTKIYDATCTRCGLMCERR